MPICESTTTAKEMGFCLLSLAPHSTPGQTGRGKGGGGGDSKKIKEAFAERQGSGCWLQTLELHTKFKYIDLLHWNHRVTESQNLRKQIQ